MVPCRVRRDGMDLLLVNRCFALQAIAGSAWECRERRFLRRHSAFSQVPISVTQVLLGFPSAP